MNLKFLLLLFAVSSVNSIEYGKRCILYNRTCIAICPRNMHAYHTQCDGQTKSQRTCHSREVYILGYTCGWSRCDCNEALLLDEDIQQCVPLDACPTKIKGSRRKNQRNPRKRYKLSSFKVSKTFDDDETQ